LRAAKAQAVLPNGKPTLFCCKTVIGLGSPNKAGSHDAHRAALGAAEVAATRAVLDWASPPFEIPADIATAWNASFAAYRAVYPREASEFERRMAGRLQTAFADKLSEMLAAIAEKPDAVATRKASQNALDAMTPLLPEFFGGSADLTGSNLTNFKGCVTAGRDRWGNHLSYGVREFGMAAIMNGIALHGGYIPYGGTFLTFSDCGRNAIRMAALMRLRAIHVFTHDSICLGEDGPTHQSVEHIPSLRTIPGLDVWRPADALETAVAWACAVRRQAGPSALCLSRQNLPRVTDVAMVKAIRKGGYVLSDMDHARVVIVSTGSELELALQAQKALGSRGPVRLFRHCGEKDCGCLGCAYAAPRCRFTGRRTGLIRGQGAPARRRAPFCT
jgi:transketolase